jgi:hypothetical protein
MRVRHECEIGALPGPSMGGGFSLPRIATLNFLNESGGAQAGVEPEQDFATRRATKSSFSRG